MGLDGFRNKRSDRDLEAGDFDESELDDLHVATPTEDPERDQYSVGEASDEEDEGKKVPNGQGNGKVVET